MGRSRVRLDRALAFRGRAWFDGRRDARRVCRRARRPARPSPSSGRDARADEVELRRATAADVGAIVGLIADDQLGATREDPVDLAAYLRAFAAIDADPAQLLVVLDDGGTVVGTMQVSFIPGLSRGGAMRGQIEAVRVAASHRGRRLGEQMIRWAVEESGRRGCALVQLTTDKSRADAHRFYERLGFTASHEGFKMTLGASAHPSPTTSTRSDP